MGTAYMHPAYALYPFVRDNFLWVGWETFAKFLSYLHASEESKGSPLTSWSLSDALQHVERLQTALNKDSTLFEREPTVKLSLVVGVIFIHPIKLPRRNTFPFDIKRDTR